MAIVDNVTLVLSDRDPLLIAAVNATLKIRVAILFVDDSHSEHSHSSPGASNEILLLSQNTSPLRVCYEITLLRQLRPKAKLIVLGVDWPSTTICKLLIQGTHGFVRYDELEHQLSRSICAVSAGRLWRA